MSYDLTLFRVPKGVDPDEAWDDWIRETESRILARSEGVDDLGPINSAKEQFKKQLATALVTRHPSLELFTPDYAKIAKVRAIDEAEARRRFRSLELNEERLGIQITLFDNSAGISLSSNGRGDQAQEALRLVWDCLQILQPQGVYAIHDSQVGKVLNLDSDFAMVLRRYAGA